MPNSTAASEKATSMTVWHYKPWWCQPWSILLTGIALISGSWIWLHRLWITGLIAVPVLAWMGFFLLLYPRLVLESGLLDAENSVGQEVSGDRPL